MDWTTERIGTLTKLWGGGLTAREIGLRLGVTKNAVVGKAHRLGLSNRQSPIVVERPREAKVVPIEMLVAGMCNWPEGDPGTPDFHFCGQPAVPDKPYCAEHCARAYVRGTKDRGAERAA